VIYRIYRIHPQEDGSVKRQLAGRFLDLEGEIHILEDYFGVLEDLPEGPTTERTEMVLSSLRRASYLDVVAEDDIKRGRRLDLLPARDFSKPK
jgi:hypothetical protein